MLAWLKSNLDAKKIGQEEPSHTMFLIKLEYGCLRQINLA